MYDILIKNGEVIDGSGTKPFIGDVAIKNGTIIKVGTNIPNAKATKIIDATGLLVTEYAIGAPAADV